MWKCANCNREFAKKNQSHSCISYPLENHFKGKEKIGKPLFEEFKKRIEKDIGPVKIESLSCCIHFVSSYTFGAAWIMKDKIRIDFRVNYNIESPRFYKKIKMSPGRYLYYMEIKDKSEIDKQLLGWVRDSYNLNK